MSVTESAGTYYGPATLRIIAVTAGVEIEWPPVVLQAGEQVELIRGPMQPRPEDTDD